MPESPFDPKLKAAALCVDVDLGEEAAPLLNDEISAGGFFDELRGGGHNIEAIRVLARAMTKTRAVRWAYECVEPIADDDGLEILDAARRWLEAPNEENRRAAFDAAEASGYETAAGWVAAAAAWSGGSMAPPDTPVVPPSDDLTSKAAAGAIGLAAVVDPEKVEEAQNACLDLGVKIASEPEQAPPSEPKRELDPKPVAAPVPVVQSPRPARRVSEPAERPASRPVQQPSPRRPPPAGGGWSPKPL